MAKTHEFVGKILTKEKRKVFRKNEFYGQFNYKITVLKEKPSSFIPT